MDNNVIAAVARSTIGNGTRSWRDPYQDRRIGYALSATIILRDMVLHGTKRDDSLGGEKYGYWRDEGSAADHENEGICIGIFGWHRCFVSIRNVNSKRYVGDRRNEEKSVILKRWV